MKRAASECGGESTLMLVGDNTTVVDQDRRDRFDKVPDQAPQLSRAMVMQEQEFCIRFSRWTVSSREPGD